MHNADNPNNMFFSLQCQKRKKKLKKDLDSLSICNQCVGKKFLNTIRRHDV